MNANRIFGEFKQFFLKKKKELSPPQNNYCYITSWAWGKSSWHLIIS